MNGYCEVHKGDAEVEKIAFCGESVDVCIECLETHTGARSREEFQSILDDSYFEKRNALLTAKGN